MMEGRSKEILLLVLAVAALGVAVYTFTGKRGSSTEPAPPAAARGEQAEVAVAEAPDEGTPTEEGAEGETRGAAPVRNPFSAPGAPPERPTGAAAEPAGEPDRPVAVAEAPSVTRLKLEGVMTGRYTMAVIRHEGKPYFVKVGDEVAERYRVQEIRSGREVVLIGQGGAIVLKAGKSS